MTSYRSVMTPRRVFVWTIVRLMSLIAFVTLAVLQFQRHNYQQVVICTIFAVAALGYLMDIFSQTKSPSIMPRIRHPGER